MSVSRSMMGLALAGLLMAAAPQDAAAQQGHAGGTGMSALEDVLAASADTPAEHKALASYYRAKAEAARGQAETHRSMAKHYSGSLKPTVAEKQKQHCGQLVELNEQTAKIYEDMAAAHEQAGSGK